MITSADEPDAEARPAAAVAAAQARRARPLRGRGRGPRRGGARGRRRAGRAARRRRDRRAGAARGVSTLPHPPRVIGVFRRGDLPREPRRATLALWRVADPGNVGTLLRAADAFGAAVALSAGSADPLGPKALRASAGAIFRVPLVAFDDAPGRRVALVAHGGTPLHELDLGRPGHVRPRRRARRPARRRRRGLRRASRRSSCRATPSRSTSRSPARSRSTSARRG